jgi:Flp pilus assembly CpaF family ATPase
MPLLKNKIQEDRDAKKAIDDKLSDIPLRPTETEADKVKEISERIAAWFRDEIADKGFTEKIKEKVKAAIAVETNNLKLDYESQKRIENITIANITGLGPIEPYILDNSVTEIIVQKYDNICIERSGKIYPMDAAFLSEAQLRTIIGRIVQPVGRQINLYTPMVDARLPNGSRVNATIPPVTPDGATLTIRKFPESVMTGRDYLRLDSLNQPMLDFLSKCVEGRVSLIVSGGTSTGKTTLLNMLSTFIPKDELIITIEDSCELNLSQPNVRRMEARSVNTEGMMPVTIQSLVRNALRMRPDRLIVGEIRDGTVVDLMSAMSTGHDGSMSTVHANSPRNLVNARLPILYSMNQSTSFSEDSQRLQIAEALHLIVHIERLKTGERKITRITHVCGIDNDGKVRLRDVFIYNSSNGQFEPTGYIPDKILNFLTANGIEIDNSIFIKKEGITNEFTTNTYIDADSCYSVCDGSGHHSNQKQETSAK